MKFALRYRDQFVGAFVLTGIVLLLGAILYVGAHKRWFRHDLEYRSLFESAEGLSPGLPLELRGFAIGRVERVTLTGSNLVEVTLSVYREYAGRERFRDGRYAQAERFFRKAPALDGRLGRRERVEEVQSAHDDRP